MGDLAEQLLGQGFYNLYRRTAGVLAHGLNMQHDIDDGDPDSDRQSGLERAQKAWRRKLFEDLRGERCDPDNEHFYIYILGELGYRLYRENCVAYTGAGANTSNPRFLQHQVLLRDFANEYTLLELIRSLHVDIYYSLRRVRSLHEHPALITLDPAEVAHIIAQIREDPQRLRDYPALLRLER